MNFKIIFFFRFFNLDIYFFLQNKSTFHFSLKKNKQLVMYSKTFDSKSDSGVPFFGFESRVYDPSKEHKIPPVSSFLQSRVATSGKHYQAYTRNPSNPKNTTDFNALDLFVLNIETKHDGEQENNSASDYKMQFTVQSNFMMCLDHSFVHLVVAKDVKNNPYFTTNTIPKKSLKKENELIDFQTQPKKKKTYATMNDYDDDDIEDDYSDSDSESDNEQIPRKPVASSSEVNSDSDDDDKSDVSEMGEDEMDIVNTGYRKTLFTIPKQLNFFDRIKAEGFDDGMADKHLFEHFKILFSNQLVVNETAINPDIKPRQIKLYKTLIEVDMKPVYEKYFSSGSNENIIIKIFLNNVFCLKKFDVAENETQEERNRIDSTIKHNIKDLMNDVVSKEQKKLVKSTSDTLKQNYYHYMPFMVLNPCCMILVDDQQFESRDSQDSKERFTFAANCIPKIFNVPKVIKTYKLKNMQNYQ